MGFTPRIKSPEVRVTNQGFRSFCFQEDTPLLGIFLLGGQALSALCSATGNDLATVLVGHSFTEAVLFCAMTFLRLIRSFHGFPSLITKKDSSNYLQSDIINSPFSLCQ